MSSFYVPGLVLTREEKIVYEYIFNMADIRKQQRVDAMMVRKMFTMANPPLAQQILVAIWDLSNQSRLQGALSKQDFYRALRYIALAQSGEAVSKETLSTSNTKRVPLPVLNGFNNKAIVANYSRPRPRSASPAASRSPARRSQVAPQVQPNPAGVGAGAPPPAGGKILSEEEWVMTDQDQAKYLRFFLEADLDRDGFVSGKEANQFFRMSGLRAAILRDVWILADVDRNNKLDKIEFAIAMHLIMKIRAGAQVPKPLPKCLFKLKVPSPSQEQQPPKGPDDPLSGFMGGPPSTLQRQPSKLAMADPDVVIPLQSNITAANARKVSFDEELKLTNMKLTESLAEVAELKAKLESLQKESEELDVKIKKGQEELEDIGQQRAELSSQVQDRHDTVQVKKETLSIIEEKLLIARQEFNTKNQAFLAQTEAMDKVVKTEQEMEQEIERLKREGETLDLKIMRSEKLAKMTEGRANDCLERKKAQEMIIMAKKEQLEIILNSTADSKGEIAKSKAELEVLKQESQRLRNLIRANGGSYKERKAIYDTAVVEERAYIAELKQNLKESPGDGQPGDVADSARAKKSNSADEFGDDSFDTGDPFADAAPTSTQDNMQETKDDPGFGLEFPKFDMEGDNPFGENPFADATDAEAKGTETEAVTNGDESAAVAADESFDFGAQGFGEEKQNQDKPNDADGDPFGGSAGDPFAGSLPAPEAAASGAQSGNKKDSDDFGGGDMFDDMGMDFGTAGPGPAESTPAAAATEPDDDPFSNVGFDFGGGGSSGAGREAKSDEAKPNVPSSQPPAVTTSSVAIDDVGPMDDMFMPPAQKKTDPKPPAQTSNNDDSFDFGDDDGFDFSAAAPPKSKPKKEKKKAAAAAPAPAPAAAAAAAVEPAKADDGFDTGFDDNMFASAGETKKSEGPKPTPKPAPATKPKPTVDDDDENPFGDAFGSGGIDDEDNPFDVGGGSKPKPKQASKPTKTKPMAASKPASKPADFDTGFDDEDFDFT